MVTITKQPIDLTPFVEKSQLLTLLDEAGRKRLIQVAEILDLGPAEIVVKEGDPGDAFFLLYNGELKVFIDDFGQSKEVARLGSGTFFGEIATLTDQPRSATIETVTASRIIRFPRDEVRSLLDDYPQLKELVSRVGVKRSEDTLQKVLED